MGRRYLGLAIFAIVWIIVLSVPTLRMMLPLPVRSDFSTNEALAARYPNDPRVQATVAEHKHRLSPDQYAGEPYVQPSQVQGLIRDYDDLIRQFPKEIWLIAARLKWTVLQSSSGRVAGDLEKGMPERKSSFTPEQLAKAIALAGQGRRLEPHNSYYDWMLAYFLFGAHRDEEALSALHEGAQKMHYDDHAGEQAQARIATLELDRLLPFEAKLAAWSSSMYPHLTHRHVARLAVWEAVEAERAGDHARALQIYGDVARLGRQMRDSNYTIIGALVGGAIQHTAWSGGRQLNSTERQIARKQRSVFTRLRVEQFAKYATSHGRADLAHEAWRDGETYIRFRESSERYVEVFGLMSNPIMGKAIVFRAAGIAFLGQMLVTLALWLILSALLWRGQKGEKVRDVDIASSTLLCGVVITMLFIGFLRHPTTDSPVTGSISWGAYLMPQLLLLGSLIVVTPIVLGALHCAWATKWRYRKRVRATSGAEGPNSTTDEDAVGNVPTAGRPLIRPHIILSTVAAILSWVLSLAVIGIWLALIFSGPMVGAGTIQLLVPIGLSFAALMLWIVKWLWITPPPLRAVTRYAVRWYRSTLGVFVVLSSVAYLVVSLAAIPVWREVDANVDALIQQGEVAMLNRNNKP